MQTNRKLTPLGSFTIAKTGFVAKSTKNVIGEVDYDEETHEYVCFIKSSAAKMRSIKQRIARCFNIPANALIMEEF